MDCWEDFTYSQQPCRHGLTFQQAERKLKLKGITARLRAAVEQVNEAHSALRRALAETD